MKLLFDIILSSLFLSIACITAFPFTSGMQPSSEEEKFGLPTAKHDASILCACRPNSEPDVGPV